MTTGEQEGRAWGIPVQAVYRLRSDDAVQQFRLTFTLVAAAPWPIAARPGRRGQYLAAPCELPGIWSYPAEPGDGAVPGRCARRAPAAAECPARGSRVRTDLA